MLTSKQHKQHHMLFDSYLTGKFGSIEGSIGPKGGGGVKSSISGISCFIVVSVFSISCPIWEGSVWSFDEEVGTPITIITRMNITAIMMEIHMI